MTREDLIELIPETRRRFLELHKANPENYDQPDIERVETDEWWTLRFLRNNRGNIDETVSQLDSALKFRKEFGINKRTVRDLPQEFVKAGAIFPYGKDIDGRTMIYMRVKVHRKVPQLSLFFKQFVFGVINLVDLEAGESGYAIVFDVTGVGLSNADMDFLQFFISTLKMAFPYGLQYVLVYNFPRLLRPLWTIAKIWVGRHQKIIKFADRDQIKEHIPAECLPKYLGGDADVDFTQPPDGCRTVKDLAPEYGFTDDDVAKYLRLFEPHIKEAYKLVHEVK